MELMPNGAGFREAVLAAQRKDAADPAPTNRAEFSDSPLARRLVSALGIEDARYHIGDGKIAVLFERQRKKEQVPFAKAMIAAKHLVAMYEPLLTTGVIPADVPVTQAEALVVPGPAKYFDGREYALSNLTELYRQNLRLLVEDGIVGLATEGRQFFFGQEVGHNYYVKLRYAGVHSMTLTAQILRVLDVVDGTTRMMFLNSMGMHPVCVAKEDVVYVETARENGGLMLRSKGLDERQAAKTIPVLDAAATHIYALSSGLNDMMVD